MRRRCLTSGPSDGPRAWLLSGTTCENGPPAVEVDFSERRRRVVYGPPAWGWI